MTSGRPDILMLGWEFPPAYTGGLGIATNEIVKSLSHHVNIHLVVPYAEGGPEGVTVTGLNDPDSELAEMQLSDEDREILKGFYRVGVRLSSYATTSGRGHDPSYHAELVSGTWKDVSARFFSSPHLYGDDIRQRTALFARAVRQIASRVPFDAVYAHDWPTFPAAMDVKEHTGKPVILHVHSLETDRGGFETRNEIYDLEHAAMLEADRVVAVSRYTRKQIIERYKIPADKIVVAYNGAEKTEPSTFQKPSHEKWISFVGRVTGQKGPQFVVETAAKLIRKCPEARFVIAGRGDYFESMLHEVARQRMGRYFIFAGFLSREKVRDLFAVSHAYFMPSVSEPFGLSAIEAAQHRVPSVISERSGASEILPGALHADFWDTDSFANYLYAILRYPALHASMAQQAVHAVADMGWEHTADKIRHVLDDVLSD